MNIEQGKVGSVNGTALEFEGEELGKVPAVHKRRGFSKNIVLYFYKFILIY